MYLHYYFQRKERQGVHHQGQIRFALHLLGIDLGMICVGDTVVLIFLFLHQQKEAPMHVPTQSAHASRFTELLIMSYLSWLLDRLADKYVSLLEFVHSMQDSCLLKRVHMSYKRPL